MRISISIACLLLAVWINFGYCQNMPTRPQANQPTRPAGNGPTRPVANQATRPPGSNNAPTRPAANAGPTRPAANVGPTRPSGNAGPTRPPATTITARPPGADGSPTRPPSGGATRPGPTRPTEQSNPPSAGPTRPTTLTTPAPTNPPTPAPTNPPTPAPTRPTPNNFPTVPNVTPITVPNNPTSALPEIGIREPRCPMQLNPSAPTLLPHSTDCSRFIQCGANGMGFERICPESQHFDVARGWCSFPDVAQCANRYPTTINPRPTSRPQGGIPDSRCPMVDQSSRTVHLPHATDCSKFYKCMGGMAFEKDCPAGQHFNVDRDWCDWPRLANCQRMK